MQTKLIEHYSFISLKPSDISFHQWAYTLALKMKPTVELQRQYNTGNGVKVNSTNTTGRIFEETQ